MEDTGTDVTLNEQLQAAAQIMKQKNFEETNFSGRGTR
jgi:hypothetical protein